MLHCLWHILLEMITFEYSSNSTNADLYTIYIYIYLYPTEMFRWYHIQININPWHPTLFSFISDIEGELYDVRDCDINRYTMTFNMPVKRGIHDLYFAWQNLLLLPEPSVRNNLYIFSTCNGIMSTQIISKSTVFLSIAHSSQPQRKYWSSTLLVFCEGNPPVTGGSQMVSNALC